MVVLLAVVLTSMGTTLYDLQINNGDEYYKQSKYKIAETEIVEAGRGQILDRNGRALVSDKAVYQVKLNTALMGDNRNATLLSLIQASRENGVTWADSLPISSQPPYVFTTPSPYYTITQHEDGTQAAALTRLGRLAVKMKWIQDPTKAPERSAEEPQQTPSQKEPSLMDKIKGFFTGASPETTVPEVKTEERSALPSASELLDLMCASFGLNGTSGGQTASADSSSSPENPGAFSPEDIRAVAGVLYELYLRAREVYQIPYLFAEDVDIDFISRVKELSLAGVVIEATTVRQYHTAYAAHLLGRVGLMSEEEWATYKDLDQDGDGVPDYQMDDTIGKEGIEKAFESYLRGTPGKRALERSTSGKVVSETWLTEPKPGDNVVLTIDLDLQMAVEDILANALPNLISKEVAGASCVVLDVNSAEVLASASYPTFRLATYSSDYQTNVENPLKPLFNRALQGTYAPGSTFKMVTAIAGLEEGIITPSTRILDEGRYTFYPGIAPQCWIYRQYHTTHGWQNVTAAIKNSCNYFFYDVGRQLGIQRLTDFASRFGLGQKTGLELSESQGVMAGPEYTQKVGGTWYDGNTLSVAIGQESSQFTPIQLANYIATLVNGGTRNSTHLLKEVKSSDFSQVLYTYQPQVLSTIEIQDKNLDAVKAGMLALTTEGSVAKYFKDLGVTVGAKTGSAQVSAQTESNAVFVCFAPYDKPEVAVAIVVEHGGSGSELGAMAADILSCYFSAQETREELLTENTLIR